MQLVQLMLGNWKIAATALALTFLLALGSGAGAASPDREPLLWSIFSGRWSAAK